MESRKQHDIRVTEHCDRYHKSQGKSIERISQLCESVSIIRQSQTNFGRGWRLDTGIQTTKSLRNIESEANRQRQNNGQIRANSRYIPWREINNVEFK